MLPCIAGSILDSVNDKVRFEMFGSSNCSEVVFGEEFARAFLERHFAGDTVLVLRHFIDCSGRILI